MKYLFALLFLATSVQADYVCQPEKAVGFLKGDTVFFNAEEGVIVKQEKGDVYLISPIGEEPLPLFDQYNCQEAEKQLQCSNWIGDFRLSKETNQFVKSSYDGLVAPVNDKGRARPIGMKFGKCSII